MVTLEQIREKFSGALNAPDSTCSRCLGSGIDIEMTERAERTTYLRGEKPCICLYVDAELRDAAMEGFKPYFRQPELELN